MAGREQTIVTSLRDAVRQILDELVARLAAAGYPEIRATHSQVFENLDPGGTRLTVLAERAGMAHPSMSQLVDGLERLGHLERVPDPTDGRARLVRLTGPGRKLQRVALAELAMIEEQWRGRLLTILGVAPAEVSARPSPLTGS